MNNNLIKIQEMLMREMIRLDEVDEHTGTNVQEEISRANALSQNAMTFIKTINIGLRIIEVSSKFELSKDKLTLDLGVENEK